MSEESKKERIDRELIELLNGLRVALPGVQVLFAFLLTVPFSNGYSRMSGFQRDVFFATFISTAIATAFLIAPSTNHRIQFRQDDKERLLMRANWLAIVGTVFLAFAVMGAVFLITDIIFGVLATSLATGLLGLLIVWLWYVIPVYRRLTGPGERTAG